VSGGLAVEGLGVRYGKTVALNGVSLEVAPREVVALVGANGAGKSSLLNALLGLVPAQAGSIRFGGQRLDGLPTRARIAVGLALSPEGRRVFPELSVEENLDLGDLGRDLAARGRRRDDVYRGFPRLLERRTQRAGTMSGGEQQMLAIGRALMAAPKLLLLDEPTLGLAPVIVREIAHFVRQAGDAGMAVVLAEQNAEMALGVADRAYVLQNGEIVMHGPAAQVAANPEVRDAYLGL
jgi:branched-chain amino acid transport system ATP-binding protein